MNGLRDAALAYAERGWGVFPLHGIVNGLCTCGRRDCSSPGKHPLVRRGLHDATTDQQVVGRWWRQWRRANVGLATGAESGSVVVDIDLPVALPSLEALMNGGLVLPPTLCALTGGGGIHLFYTSEDSELGNSVGGLPGHPAQLPGVDLRANGGYVVAPPSTHRSGTSYSWVWPRRRLHPAPEWLKEPEPVSIASCAAGPADFTGDGSAYGLHVLRAEIARIAAAPPGRRNHTLNRAAFAVAQVIVGGELLEAPAWDALLSEALSAGLSAHEAALTVASAFRAGRARPRSAPHRVA